MARSRRTSAGSRQADRMLGASKRVGQASPTEQPEVPQREKFIQAAREAGCDETGEALDEALRTIGRARKR
jgi:hypothetical protein